MSYYQRDPDGQIVMVCQVCKTNCHPDGPKKVQIFDKEISAFRSAECPLCVCHDCVQTADDPVRQRLAPLILGQTLESGENLLADGTRVSRPGLFNIEQALSQAKLALVYQPERSKPHALPQAAACKCGAPAGCRCILCERPFCSACLSNGHLCEG